MANVKEIKIPDIGGATQVDVIEILVQVGDKISIDTPLVTLETDKASMEIPSSTEGTITAISMKVGDKVAEGDVILSLETAESETKSAPEVEEKSTPVEKSETPTPPSPKVAATSQLIEVKIPDIGGATDVDVIDVQIKVGDKIDKDQSLVTLEGDKATMDIPSPYSGVVKEVLIKLGTKVAQNSPILVIETSDGEPQPNDSAKSSDSKPADDSIAPKPEAPVVSKPTTSAVNEVIEYSAVLSAGPAVRRMARELGVNLSLVKGSGRKTRITKEDVQSYVKAKLSEKQGGTGFGLPAAPVIDFTKFGDIETKPLNKIKKITGINVHRSWITIPHVTQFDEADITDLEAFRKSESQHASEQGYKLTILAFVCGVVSKALQAYPQFNASLDASGENLIYKKYCNIGIAVETPNGLVVPVIKNVDKLSVAEIAIEMAKLSTKARDKGLLPTEMSGGCFTISSLGGIGGTAFTPIVNSPEVAILGLSRAAIRPVYEEGEFKPKLMLPLSLSYDHRVIDGAEAARFTRFIADALVDIRRILL